MSKSISEDCPAQPKRIVICCDGTWQSATGLDRKTGAASNVAKLCQILASAGTEGGKEYQQVVYYDAGVGTGDIGWVQAAIQGMLSVPLYADARDADFTCATRDTQEAAAQDFSRTSSRPTTTSSTISPVAINSTFSASPVVPLRRGARRGW